MIVLALVGFFLLFTAPLISRVVLGKKRDTLALTRGLQLFAIALLVTALLIRPYNRDTTAIPVSPDAPAGGR